MKRELFTLASVLTAVSAVMCANVISTVAAQPATTTLQWFAGAPTADLDGKYQSLNELSHDGKIRYTSYEIRGKGRLQWGEQNPDGKYQVYYDANDIRVLAEEVNRQTEEYNKVYEQYRSLVNSLH